MILESKKLQPGTIINWEVPRDFGKRPVKMDLRVIKQYKYHVLFETVSEVPTKVSITIGELYTHGVFNNTDFKRIFARKYSNG